MFNLSALLLFVFIQAYTPGPNIITSLGNATRLGFKKSYPYNLGIFAGLIIVMSGCAIFSSLLVTYFPKIRPVLQIVGAAYLLWLAYKTFRSSSDFENGKEGRSGFLSGLLLQFVNPKTYLYGTTAMTVYILPYYNQPIILFGFAALIAFMGFSGTVVWSVFGSLFRSLFQKHGKVVNAVLALLLVYCAVMLFF
ncbi:LysE family transporter [Oscillospiraceae bacterium OttesenSCG-928-G22]|nr:LysE family transporter [Oscillospiraceae bacterium OttesenSCG-928-G22]